MQFDNRTSQTRPAARGPDAQTWAALRELVAQAPADVALLPEYLAVASVSTLATALRLGGTFLNAAYPYVLAKVQAGDPEARETLRTSIDRRALYPGSFDPFTKGHRDVLERAASDYDEVVVGIAENISKKSLFSIAERIAMIEEDARSISGNIRVVKVGGLLAHFAQRERCKTLVRGVRAGITDPDLEAQIADLNRHQTTGSFQLKTVFIPALAELNNFASSKVKEIAFHGGSIDAQVSAPIAAAVMQKHAAALVREVWNSGCELLPGEKSAALLDDVIKRYAEPHRHYHVLGHVFFGLKLIDEHADLFPHLADAKLAFILHDAVNHPESRQNEENSARLSTAGLSAIAIDGERIARIHKWILATKDHKISADDAEGRLLLDVDISILGTRPEQYFRYTDAVRAEYEPFYGSEVFTRERAKFMEKLLEQRPLFSTGIMAERFEEQARLNIAAELRLLAAQLQKPN